MAWACTAANGTGSLVFSDDVTAERSSKMNSDVFRAKYCAHIQLTVQVDNEPKQKEILERLFVSKAVGYSSTAKSVT